MNPPILDAFGWSSTATQPHSKAAPDCSSAGSGVVLTMSDTGAAAEHSRQTELRVKANAVALGCDYMRTGV